ncbi:hypothetical protein B5C34_03375 [Pacificimonas flava]|uniref:Ketoreductase domain-containing protein n=2 Tax=Pacificimonas TaxID=1960290 RepID=A0A219B337_9SPHN|nr:MULTISPECIES: SDR family oxidoreductase [Pacificimonas]MBZ6377741.1 SDR family oxidoreductase [Pacificimonas aurantium]OWV32584.1 hypothetical protein B5C34_03375 [Pacificimonas flava]
MPAPTPFQPKGSVCIVTGGANGIGLALARTLKAAGAAHVALADLDETALAEAAVEIGGLTFPIDVADFAAVSDMVEAVEEAAGPVGLFCANAGIGIADPDPADASSAPLDAFESCFRVNCIAHIVAAKVMMSRYLRQGGGWFLNTVSAAGLLSQIGSAPYSVSKHAAIGFAESLAYTGRDSGVGVTALCPQAVRTAMIGENPEEELKGGADVDGILEPEEVAAAALEGLTEGRFLVTPHPHVRGYMQAKAADYDRWIGGMAKLRRSVM